MYSEQTKKVNPSNVPNEDESDPSYSNYPPSYEDDVQANHVLKLQKNASSSEEAAAAEAAAEAAAAEAAAEAAAALVALAAQRKKAERKENRSTRRKNRLAHLASFGGTHDRVELFWHVLDNVLSATDSQFMRAEKQKLVTNLYRRDKLLFFEYASRTKKASDAAKKAAERASFRPTKFSIHKKYCMGCNHQYNDDSCYKVVLYHCANCPKR